MFKTIKQFFSALIRKKFEVSKGLDQANSKVQLSPELQELVDSTRKRSNNQAVEQLAGVNEQIKRYVEEQARANAEEFAAPAKQPQRP